MNRRTLLQRTAALVAAGATAGCLAGGSDGGSESTRTTSTRTTTATSTTTTTERPENAFETMQVGSRDGVLDPENNRAHAVRVTNAADEPRTIGVQVRASGGNPLVESDSWELPAQAWTHVDLLTPAEYTVVVSLDGEEAGRVAVERSWFDCNASTTNVTVTADGDVESETISTTMGCGPSVRGRSLRIADTGCWTDGETESASVTFGDGALDVTGTVRVPSPDYGLAVAGVEWDLVDGPSTLAVTVATTEAGQVGGGVQCVGAIDYEATLAVDGGLPERVVVRHRSGDGPRDVATVDRESTTTDGQ